MTQKSVSLKRAEDAQARLVDRLSEIADFLPEHLEALGKVQIKVASEEIPRLEQRFEQEAEEQAQAPESALRDICHYVEKFLMFITKASPEQELEDFRDATFFYQQFGMDGPYIGVGIKGEEAEDEARFEKGIAAELGHAFKYIITSWRGGGISEGIGDLADGAFKQILVPDYDDLTDIYALCDLYYKFCFQPGSDIQEAVRQAAESLEQEDKWGLKDILTQERIEEAFGDIQTYISEAKSAEHMLGTYILGEVVMGIQLGRGCSYEEALDMLGPVVVKALYDRNADMSSMERFMGTIRITDYLKEMP